VFNTVPWYRSERMRTALVLVITLVAPVAFAQPADLAKEFQAGVDAYRLGKYDEARAHLEKARNADPKLPGPYRFLSVVAKAQGRWDDCIENARKALEANPRSAETADTRKVHDECRESAGRMPYRTDLGDGAAISVTTNVSGATIKINGLTYGGTPLAPRPITAGPLEIEIEKQGWKPQKVTVNALAGVVTDLAVDLDADPNAKSDVEVSGNQVVRKVGWLVITEPSGATLSIDGTPTELAPQIEIAPGTHEIELRRADFDPWRRRVRISTGQKVTVTPELVESAPRAARETRGYYLLGAGGAILLGGFITSQISREAANEVRDITRIERERDPGRPLSETGMIAPVRTRAELDEQRDKAARWGLISDVTYGVGLVTVGVGAYFLYKGARERADVPAPFAVAPTRGGLFVAKELVW
jgi:hypothetical protein